MKRQNIGKHGLLGGLFFDEVKIKEGLVFDPSSFELIGFADIENSIHDLELLCASKQSENDEKPEQKLATHVLQNLTSLAVFSHKRNNSIKTKQTILAGCQLAPRIWFFCYGYML